VDNWPACPSGLQNPSKEAILRDFFYTASGHTLAGNAAEASAPTESEEEGCGEGL
jgi:hypothetical protein